MSGYNMDVPSSPAQLEEYFAALKQGSLLTSRCTECTAYHFPPRPACPHCGATNSFAWESTDGRGTVWSLCTFHKKYLAGFDDPPYLVAVIALDDGSRRVSTVVGIDRTEVRIGMRVQAIFDNESLEPRVRFIPFDDGRAVARPSAP